MYSINDYLNKDKYQVLFKYRNVFVIQEDLPEPIGVTYMVSDGDSMYSTSEKPILQLDWLLDSLGDYRRESQETIQQDVLLNNN